MSIFKKKQEPQKCLIGIGDRILCLRTTLMEQKWFQEHPQRHKTLVEGVIMEISPSGNHYAIKIDNVIEWHHAEDSLHIVEHLKPSEVEK